MVISQPFAEAHQLAQGDYISVILNGQAERLFISGVGLSPEFVYQVGPSSILPDYLRYGTFWMPRPALESALELQGLLIILVFACSPMQTRKLLNKR